MRAALQSATKILQFLLCIFYTEKLSLDEQDHILHSRNEFGNNLLSYILQQRETLKVSKQILLEMDCWNKWMNSGHHLKNNIDPSIDVLDAMHMGMKMGVAFIVYERRVGKTKIEGSGIWQWLKPTKIAL